MSVNDLHATILHLMGFNHLKLTNRYNGRDFRVVGPITGTWQKQTVIEQSDQFSFHTAAVAVLNASQKVQVQ